MTSEHEQKRKIIEAIREKYQNLTFPDGVTKSPLYHGRRERVKIDGQYAVIGHVGDEEQVFAPAVSKQYKIVPHEIALHNLVQEMTDHGIDLKEYGEPIITPTLHADGGRLQIQIAFPDAVHTVKTENHAKGRKIHPKATLWNSYDLSKGFRVSFEGIDEVCTNGMVGYKIQFATNKKHRLNLDVTKQMAALPDGLKAFSEQVNVWQDWAKQRLSRLEAMAVVDALPFGEKHQEKILALPEVGTGETLDEWLKGDDVNLYRLNGIATQFLTHEVESEMVRVDKGPKIAKVFHNIDDILRKAA